MTELLSLSLLFTSSWFLTNHLALKGRVVNLISLWLAALAQIVFVGYITSLAGRFGDLQFWLVPQFAFLVLGMVGLGNGIWRKQHLVSEFFSPPYPLRPWQLFKSLPTWQQAALLSLFSTVMLLGVANGCILILGTPHQWDSLTYHIARVAYFLQHGNIESFSSNYWAQTVHPKVSAILNAYLFMVSGRNENMFQLLQFSSYWISVLAVYGTATRLSGRRSVGCFVALLSGLLVEVLLQATTPQNDLFLMALVACILLFVVQFRMSSQWALLIMCSISLGLGLGAKASFLLTLPSLVLIGLWAVIPFLSSSDNKVTWSQRVVRLMTVMILPFALICLPSGYLENVAWYGHPLGPPEVRAGHTYGSSSAKDVLKNGTKNVLRFGMDSLSLECPFPLYAVARVNNAMRRVAQAVIEKSGCDLTRGDDSRVKFSYEKRCAAHEDGSSWGVTGFALAVPLLCVIMFRQRQLQYVLVFGSAAWLFILCQSYCGPYDPWRGRYFIQLAPFVMPLLGLIWGARQIIVRWYLVMVVAIACGTAICAITFRTGRPLLSVTYGKFRTESMFLKTRLQQLTSNRPWLLDDIQSFEATVPAAAVVAVRFPVDMYEYPLFGKGLTRTIIPFPGIQNVTTRVDYVVYCEGRQADLDYPEMSDVDPAERWIVRKLGENETADQALRANLQSTGGVKGP